MRRSLLAFAVASLLAACAHAPEPAPALSFAPGDSGITSTAPPGPTPSAHASTRSATTRPAHPTRDDGTRVLRIPAQAVAADVYDCPTKNGIVEPPPMVKDVCWWTGSRPLASSQGVSIVVGHSTRSTSSTGALERTRELPLGAIVTLAGQSWKVAQIETDVNKRGLPAWITYATGPRMLGLVTCDLTNHASNVLIRLTPA